MRRQNRGHEGLVKEVDQHICRETCRGRVVERAGDGAGSRRVAGDIVAARPPYVVFILGNIGEVRKIAERPDHLDRLVGVQRLQNIVQLAPRFMIVVAVKPDRRAPNGFDNVENRPPFLAAHDIAEQAAKKPNVFTQRQVFVRNVLVFGRKPVVDQTHRRPWILANRNCPATPATQSQPKR